jgi:UDP-glucuronate decarboxylase
MENKFLEKLIDDEKIKVLLKKLSNSSCLISGSTGMIGSQLVNLFQLANKLQDANIKIICQSRSLTKLQTMYEESSTVEFLVSDLTNNILSYSGKIDYIVHLSSPTASSDFVQKPIDVIKAIVGGTETVLNLATTKNIKKFILVSTMEIYGLSKSDTLRKEDDYTYLDHLSLRSSYPQAKKMAETMAIAYYHQKQVPIVIARLTQTFGYGVPFSDQRVFAQFGRAIVNNKPIVLHSLGETKRNYLHISDALSALLTLLVKGVSPLPYNVANEEIYISILEMAKLLSATFTNNEVKVKVAKQSKEDFSMYAPPLMMNLETAKLKSLGWEAKHNLIEMFRDMFTYWDTTK